ncbi:hypothetical protein [Cyanobacterium sp. Dongsha4]|uniref:hypothetical protein n=1 Tax=Cyanobacterium sp. DS4 TaxID=2878255 RepID=UPI002E811505|nr:hypothetical protein [Cyanobacterium sp. Dongsha4]WVL01733.1 hypothetical protein Dongsha4_05955 [Cyanobacterium sp. Dongsha4]
MLKTNTLFTFSSLLLLTFSGFSVTKEAIAQSSNKFNRQQCIQNLVKDGLKSEDASVWCNYNEQCLVRSQKEGLHAEAAKSVCDCTIKTFRNKYTTQKFREITKKSETDKKIANQLREVGEICFEEILFE